METKNGKRIEREAGIEAMADSPIERSEIVVVRVGTPFFAKDDYIVLTASPKSSISDVVRDVVGIAEKDSPEVAEDIKDLLKSTEYQIRANGSPVKEKERIGDYCTDERTDDETTTYKALDIELVKTVRGGRYLI